MRAWRSFADELTDEIPLAGEPGVFYEVGNETVLMSERTRLRSFQISTVFLRSIVAVRGPIPPGTGVISDALLDACKSHVNHE